MEGCTVSMNAKKRLGCHIPVSLATIQYREFAGRCDGVKKRYTRTDRVDDGGVVDSSRGCTGSRTRLPRKRHKNHRPDGRRLARAGDDRRQHGPVLGERRSSWGGAVENG